MLTIILFGIGVILLSIAINIIQLQPGIRALANLNARTYSWVDRMMYPFRFICIAPKLIGPLLLDTIIMGIGGTVGLGGGVMGFIIGLSSSCLISMAIKLSLWLNKKSANKRFSLEGAAYDSN